jgi:phosphoribosylformylglycinamidine (FGAM) synthase-like amidotransferase family enzyme
MGDMLNLAGKIKLVVPGGFDLGDKITEQDFHDWYNKEVSDIMICAQQC